MGDDKVEQFGKYRQELKGLLDGLPLEKMAQLCDILHEAYRADRALFLFGNGGSAALASHMACDLGKGTHPLPKNSGNVSPARRFRVLSLTDNVPLITAWSNDLSYEDIFAEQLANFIQPRDVAFGISGSGNSPNILKALKLARQKQAITVGFSGEGGKMIKLLDCAVVVPSRHMQLIEDAHLIMAHMVFLNLKERIARSEAT
jgi:D-sedoheptulose 7-phosphate isomerase